MQGILSREVSRTGPTRHVGVAGVSEAAAQVGGVDEHRVDNQGLGGVIGGDLKTDLPLKNKAFRR